MAQEASHGRTDASSPPGGGQSPAAHESVQPPPLAEVGGYALLRLLASGKNGRVYEARHLATGHAVALKCVLAPGAGRCALLRREIHALRRVREPGVVRILDAGVVDGAPWYAMELLSGETLADVIARAAAARVADRAGVPVIPFERVLALGAGLAAALGALEERGLVHGDLKPANVMLRGPDEPVLVDFGFASRFPVPGQPATLEPPLGVAGTPCYLAPELLLGAEPDPRTDLYALGCILYELLVGEPPIAADRLARAWLGQEAPPRVSERVPLVPVALDDLVARLLAPRPAERLARAQDVIDAFAELGMPRRARGPRPPQLRRSRLIGRDAALDVLLAATHAAREGRGGAIVIRGESGIGKSRLAAEWLRRIAGTLEIVVGEASSLGAHAAGSGRAPLHSLRSLFAHIAECCAEGGPDTTERLLGNGRAAQLAPFASELAPLAAGTAEPVAGPAARARLMRALREVLEAVVATAPLVLVLDDLQWSDELTLGFLASLPEGWLSARRLLVVAVLRRGEEPPGFNAFLGNQDAKALELDSLEPESLDHLVRDVAGLQAAPPALGAFLAARTGGNPLHVTEWIGAALSSRLLERVSPGRLCLPDGQEADAEALESLPIAGSLGALLAGRLAALEGDARRLVEAAAVLGRRFDEDALAALAGLAEEPTLDAVAALLAAQVLDADADGDLRFVHDQMAERAYAELPEVRRRDLHARAAGLLRARATRTAEPAAFEATIAHHWYGAGEEGRAAVALARAADFSMRRSAFAAARDQWLQAAALQEGRSGQGPVAFDISECLLGAAHAAGALGDAASVDALARQALARLGEPCPSSDAGQLGRAIADLVAILAGRWLGRPVRSGPDQERLRIVARASDFLVQARFFSDDLTGMIVAAGRAVRCAERIGDPGVVLRSHATLASLAGSLRLRRLSEEWFARAGLVAQQRGDEREAALSLATRAVYLLGEGQLAASRDVVQEAARRIEASGDAWIHEIVLTTSGHVAHYQGDYETAIDCYRHVLASGRARHSPQVEAWGHFSLARSLLPCGRTAAARDHLEQAACLLARRPELQSEVICLGLLALARRRMGDEQGARTAARDAIARLERAQQAGFPTAAGLGALADALTPRVRTGDAEAARWLRRVVRVFGRLRVLSPLTRPAIASAAGGAAIARGRRARAARHYRRGARVAERLGLPLERARALNGLASLAREGAPDRDRLRAEAIRLIEMIGADVTTLMEEMRI